MRALHLAVAVAALSACAGSQRNADSTWTEENPDVAPHRVRDTEVLNPTPIEKTPPSRSAFVGVRHDLMLSNSAPARERCSCLAVEVGAPRDPTFFWQGDRPEIGPDEVVVALGAQGVSCPGGDPVEARRRPSISAVDVENDSVIVEVEDLPLGRPLASGAIVPRPGPTGGLFIRPRNARTIYGRGTGGRLCRVK
ncbi:MAG TPA: hypothetical protein VHB21_26570 [Minicystis sp.]|nr:hypothetical protein [Minicystis sp.]